MDFSFELVAPGGGPNDDPFAPFVRFCAWRCYSAAEIDGAYAARLKELKRARVFPTADGPAAVAAAKQALERALAERNG